MKILLPIGLALVLGLAVGYSFGYDHGWEKSVKTHITSFEECAQAGYPIMESYPEQCRTPEGQNFTKKVDTPPALPPLGEPEMVFCTQDAKLCPDGSYVARTGPKCEFPPCPSN